MNEQMIAALVGAVVAGVLTIAGAILGLCVEPALRKRAKAKEVKIVYREFVRLRMKEFFADCKGVRGQLAIVDSGGDMSFLMAEDVGVLTGLIKENLGCLKPTEMLTLSLAIEYEHLMAVRRRTLNMQMEGIRRKKSSDPSGTITVELQDLKDGFLAYLEQHVELNALMCQGLVPLDVDDYVYADGKKKSHENVLAFWKAILGQREAPYDPAELAPYEPHGHQETEIDAACVVK